MIKLNKKNEPQVLVDNKEKWTREYLEYCNKGVKPPIALKFKYKIPEIKNILIQETNEKCAYCESRIRHVYPGDVEHIVPKNTNPELIFDWNNLTMACWQCNNNKLTYYDPLLPLINPYLDEPVDELQAYGPIIFAKNNSVKGSVTEEVIELNRNELLLIRAERLKSLNSLIDQWNREVDPAIKNVVKIQILKDCENSNEYSFVKRCFVYNKCGF